MSRNSGEEVLHALLECTAWTVANMAGFQYWVSEVDGGSGSSSGAPCLEHFCSQWPLGSSATMMSLVDLLSAVESKNTHAVKQ